MVKPMFRNSNSRNSLVLFAAVLAASVAASNAFSQSSQGMQNSTAGPKKSSVAAAEPRPNPNWLSRRAEMYYQGVWGVDSFRVKYTESGEIIRRSEERRVGKECRARRSAGEYKEKRTCETQGRRFG